MTKENNERKSKALGIPHGTANARLRKSLLYEFSKRLKLSKCYRCSQEIENIDEFSIEHKISWLNSGDPIKYFYDIDNIAFSHIKCNIGAASRPHKKYKDSKEQRREAFKRYYTKEDKRKQFLERKRMRSRKNPTPLSPMAETGDLKSPCSKFESWSGDQIFT